MRDITERHNEVIKKLSKRLAAIHKESENRPQWRLEQQAAALDEARRESRNLAVDLKMAAATQETASRDVFNETRKGAGKVKPAPSEALLWRQQAALLNGLEPKQAIPRYSYMLSKLTPDEKQAWKHVFDDALEFAVFGDPEFEFQAQQEIAKHRTPEEKAALRASQKAERFSEYVPTILGIFESNLKEAQSGETPANDPAEVFDRITADIDAEFAKV
jgi:hypothetical protein